MWLQPVVLPVAEFIHLELAWTPSHATLQTELRIQFYLEAAVWLTLQKAPYGRRLECFENMLLLVTCVPVNVSIIEIPMINVRAFLQVSFFHA